jgi:hypothetical protein
MKYEFFDIDNLEAIQTETLSLINNMFSNSRLTSEESVLSYSMLEENIPSLLEMLETHRYRLHRCYLVTHTQVGIKHLREFVNPVQSTRLLIPIKNFKDCDLKYYNVTQKQKLYGYENKMEIWNLCSYTDSEIIDTTQLSKPIKYRVDIPHTIYINGYSKIPVRFLNILHE